MKTEPKEEGRFNRSEDFSMTKQGPGAEKSGNNRQVKAENDQATF
ncbi:hypothetical protein [Roseivirga sp.]